MMDKQKLSRSKSELSHIYLPTQHHRATTHHVYELCVTLLIFKEKSSLPLSTTGGLDCGKFIYRLWHRFLFP